MTAKQKENNTKNKITLVFLHYFGGSKDSWQWVIDQLAESFNCIPLNVPGFGREPTLDHISLKDLAAYVKDKLTALEIDNYVLIGHSMGAKIAMQMAIEDHDRIIQRLILVAPSPPLGEPIEPDEKRRILKHPDVEEAKTTVKNITKLPLSNKQNQLAIENNLVSDAKVWKWWLNDGMNNSIAVHAKKLSLPITVINSETDPVITPQLITERVLKVFQHARLVTVKDSGHLIPMEASVWLAKEIGFAIQTE